ncbi:MAG: heme ABC transporter permease [Alphaproteobacteria bacterium]|nr:MAG: heme ABC transporter permease [Alphaproteobacteria bacterium]
MAMFDLANPKKFMDFSARLLPWISGAAVILLAIGLYLALFVAPPDYQQGESVRIMYVHVPAATLSMGVYAFMALASALALIMKHPLADMAAKAAAPIGAGFTFLALVTGSLWGKPMWGAWWAWDARLTSELVLLFLYFGYMAIWQAMEDPIKAARAAAVVALVGVVNLPVIKFSVNWWNTLHQPASLLRFEGPAIHPSMLWPLLVMFAAYGLFFAAVLILRMRMEILLRRARSLQLSQARARAS